eukprot:scaffold13084_cov112-Isochrysis_galbana.AAC.7
MPLADDAGFVTALLQLGRDGGLVEWETALRHRVVDGRDSHARPLPARQQRGTRARAHRAGRVPRRQDFPRPCQRVNVGCIRGRVPVEANVAIAEVVDEEHHHVWSIQRRTRSAEEQKAGAKHET